jgi:hypothetical protein
LCVWLAMMSFGDLEAGHMQTALHVDPNSSVPND